MVFAPSNTPTWSALSSQGAVSDTEAPTLFHRRHEREVSGDSAPNLETYGSEAFAMAGHRPLGTAAVELVPSLRLSTLIHALPGRVQLLRLSVVGSELRCLRGAGASLSRVDVIVCWVARTGSKWLLNHQGLSWCCAVLCCVLAVLCCAVLCLCPQPVSMPVSVLCLCCVLVSVLCACAVCCVLCAVLCAFACEGHVSLITG